MYNIYFFFTEINQNSTRYESKDKNIAFHEKLSLSGEGCWFQGYMRLSVIQTNTVFLWFPLCTALLNNWAVTIIVNSQLLPLYSIL